jgi:hypothetical protein
VVVIYDLPGVDLTSQAEEISLMDSIYYTISAAMKTSLSVSGMHIAFILAGQEKGEVLYL